FERLMMLPLGFYAERRVGELVSRISSDAMKIRNTLTNNLTLILSQSVTLIGSLVVMVVINWRLMTFLIVLIPVIIAIGVAFGLWLRRLSTDQQDAVAETTVVAEEALSGIRVVKSFVREDY